MNSKFFFFLFLSFFLLPPSHGTVCAPSDDLPILFYPILLFTSLLPPPSSPISHLPPSILALHAACYIHPPSIPFRLLLRCAPTYLPTYLPTLIHPSHSISAIKRSNLTIITITITITITVTVTTVITLCAPTQRRQAKTKQRQAAT